MKTLLAFLKNFWAWFLETHVYVEEPLPMSPVPVNNLLNTFCLEIKRHEGWYYGSRSYRNNNPGNVRFSSVGYLPVYGIVKKDAQNFAIFPTFELGYLYLKNLVKTRIHQHPNWTFYTFFGDEKEGWAPDSDGNDSKHYAEAVARALNVPPTSTISILV